MKVFAAVLLLSVVGAQAAIDCTKLEKDATAITTAAKGAACTNVAEASADGLKYIRCPSGQYCKAKTCTDNPAAPPAWERATGCTNDAGCAGKTQKDGTAAGKCKDDAGTKKCFSDSGKANNCMVDLDCLDGLKCSNGYCWGAVATAGTCKVLGNDIWNNDCNADAEFCDGKTKKCTARIANGQAAGFAADGTTASTSTCATAGSTLDGANCKDPAAPTTGVAKDGACDFTKLCGTGLFCKAAKCADKIATGSAAAAGDVCLDAKAKIVDAKCAVEYTGKPADGAECTVGDASVTNSGQCLKFGSSCLCDGAKKAKCYDLSTGSPLYTANVLADTTCRAGLTAALGKTQGTTYIAAKCPPKVTAAASACVAIGAQAVPVNPTLSLKFTDEFTGNKCYDLLVKAPAGTNNDGGGDGSSASTATVAGVAVAVAAGAFLA